MNISDYEPIIIERHNVHKTGWLRAAILGANDGLVSTASLLVGVAAAGGGSAAILVAGLAGLGAGAMSMAAGEYVSVSSQSDIERADIERERRELARQPNHEMNELRDIYMERGLSAELAAKVAQELHDHDALGAHARDELGITERGAARPFQAAATSAMAFAIGAISPIIVALLTPGALMLPVLFGATLVFLAILGALGAVAGGARAGRAALRVTGWGVAAMTITYAIGRIFGVAMG